MDLPSVSNAPRTLVLGGTTYRCRTLTLGQIGEVLAWLEDRAGGKVLFRSEASQIALATTEGLSVVLHLALSSCQPWLTRDAAVKIAATMDAEDEMRLASIAWRRRPGRPADPDAPPGKDLADVAWGEIFEGLSGHTPAGYEAVAQLTLDQFDCIACRGEVWDPDALDPRDVQAMWEASQKADEGKQSDE
jgi:hypothetical protein